MRLLFLVEFIFGGIGLKRLFLKCVKVFVFIFVKEEYYRLFVNSSQWCKYIIWNVTVLCSCRLVLYIFIGCFMKSNKDQIIIRFQVLFLFCLRIQNFLFQVQYIFDFVEIKFLCKLIEDLFRILLRMDKYCYLCVIVELYIITNLFLDVVLQIFFLQ